MNQAATPAAPAGSTGAGAPVPMRDRASAAVSANPAALMSPVETTRGLRARAVSLALAGAMTLVVADELTRAFPLGRLAVPVPVAAVVSVAIPAALGIRRRGSLWLDLIASATAFVVVSLLLVTHSPAVFVRGLVHGWADLLTGAVPAAGTGVELVVPVVAVWGIGLAAAELTLRREHPLAPAIPLLLGAVGARMLAARAPAWHPLAASAILVVLVGALVITRLTRPQVLAAAGLTVVVAAVAVGVGSVLPIPGSRAPFDPRTLRFVPTAPCQEIDPLAQLPGRALDASQKLFRVTTSGPSIPGVDLRVQLAVLNRYDGAQWSTAGSYNVVGSRVSPTDGNPGAVLIHQQVNVLRLSGCDVPAPAGLVDAAGVPLLFDPVTGALTSPGGVHPGERYSLTASVVDTAGIAGDMTGAQPARDPSALEDLQLPPGVPVDLRRDAKDAVAAATSPFGEAADLQQWFQVKGGFSSDPNAPAGHTLARLAELLAPKGHVGTSEQYATAFALMARVVGLPSRVVVGADLGSLRPGTETVTNGQIQAWPEVDFAGLGWVPFNPTPGHSSGKGTAPEPVDSAPSIAKRVAQQQASAAASPSHRSGGAGHHGPVLVRAHPRSVLGTVAGVAVVVLMLLAFAELAVVVAKRWRRGKRRAAAAADRCVLGAWQEALDRLQERGMHVERSSTAADVVSAAAEVVPAAAAYRIQPAADVYNWTAFNPEGAGPQHATAAWESVDAMTRELRRTSPWSKRARAALDPRPLLRAR